VRVNGKLAARGAVALAIAAGCNRPGPRPEPERAAPPVAAAPAAAPAPAASGYELPPEDVVRIVDAQPTPLVAFDHARRRLVLADHPALPPIELLAEPFVRVAGLRIHPDRATRRTTRFFRAFEIRDVDSDRRVQVQVPEGRLGEPDWSPDGSHLAFTVGTPAGDELWIASTEDGRSVRLSDRHVSGILGDAFFWAPDGSGLYARLVPAARGPAPTRPAIPGPTVEQTERRRAQNRTYPDLLETEHDEATFVYYATVQLARVDLQGAVTELGDTGPFLDVDVSPDGAWLLVQRLRPPWSHRVPYDRFAHTIEVWSPASGTRKVLADLDAAEEVPIEGVPTGLRGVHWRPTAPATLVWAEALDGGDPDVPAEHRDRLLARDAPFDAEPREVGRVTHRFVGIDWLDRGDELIVSEYDRDRRWLTERLRDLRRPEIDRVLVDRSVHDRYGDPGSPVHERIAGGRTAVRVREGAIYREGDGATASGDRPFLDRVPLDGGPAERRFHAPQDAYATFVAFAGADAGRLVLRRESPTRPPDYFVREGDSERALTAFPHPHPQLSAIDRRLLKYRRRDGVPLSGTLYLPPGHDGATPLPLVVWAYPREYTDADTAGQVRAAPTRFTRLEGTSPLMFLTQGYAVLDGAAIPIVGDPKTMNDTFVQQVAWAAEAAIDAAADAAPIDRERVAVAGHSYGAFMVANLLAHTDLFRAGIARSGAYNRTLTPFGFQSERRTLWEAPEAYARVSPLFHADRIDEPILLVHGEIDANEGTFPLQSQRLFHALAGLGGTARLVVLPHESHGYLARESVLHVLAESFRWLDRWVARAEPRPGKGRRR
jgi:dipeptidyl aminopeptidase/acylaminoacyl peptidase